jgi:hypothetical protein
MSVYIDGLVAPVIAPVAAVFWVSDSPSVSPSALVLLQHEPHSLHDSTHLEASKQQPCQHQQPSRLLGDPSQVIAHLRQDSLEEMPAGPPVQQVAGGATL